MDLICAACGEHSSSENICSVCGQPPLLKGRFRLEQILGRGGIGTTYAAVNVNTGKLLAIKEVALRRVSDEKARQLLEREAAVLRQLNHRAIPRCEDSFIEGTGKHRAMYIVQERIDGQTLAEEMKTRRYRPDEVLDIAEELLQVVDYLQSLSPPVIHRDIKPANVMRRRSNNALVLIDFGSVRDALKDPDLGGSTVAGTFGFMAPEQLMGDADPRSDLYGIGALMVNMLAQQDPQRMMSLNGLDWKPHIRVHPALEQFLETMLASDPNDRPKDASAAQRLLHQTRRNMARPMRSKTPSLPATAERTPNPGRLTPQIAIFAAGLALTVLVVFGSGAVMFFLMKPIPEPAVVQIPDDLYVPEPPGPLFPPQPPEPVNAPPTPTPPTPPQPTRIDGVDVWVGDLPPSGDPNAHVKMIVFTDYQCPFCARHEQTLDKLRAEYRSDQLVIYWRDYPLPFHQQANGAHMAARCAHEQGRYAQMHDTLFDHQGSLSIEGLISHSGGAGVPDYRGWKKCLDEGRYQSAIDRDKADGEAAGVKGTPSMFINGQFISGAQPFNTIKEIIDQKLREPPLPETLSRDDVAKVMRQNTIKFRNCYQNQLNRDPELSGAFTVEMIINHAGRVQDATVKTTTLNHDGVEKCILTQIKRLRFPPSSGDPLTVRYPFSFTAN
ncbi:MAG: thioredoxin domain-containing protein [Myxococcota bacterium]